MDIYNLLAGAGGGVAASLIVGQVCRDLKQRRQRRREDREREKKLERDWLDRRFAECTRDVENLRRGMFKLRDDVQTAAAGDRKFASNALEELDKRLSALSAEIENTEKGVAHLNRRIRAAEKVLTDAGCGWGDDHGVAVVTGGLKSGDAPKTLPQAPQEWFNPRAGGIAQAATHDWPKNPKV